MAHTFVWNSKIIPGGDISERDGATFDNTMALRHILSLLCVCIAVAQGFSQPEDLLKTLVSAPADTSKVRLLRALGWKYLVRDADSSHMFYQQSLELAIALDDRHGEIQGLLNMSSSYGRRGDDDHAYPLLYEARQKAILLDDPKMLAMCYSRLALYYSRNTHRPDSAFMYFAKVEAQNTRAGNTYQNWNMYLYRGELFYMLGMVDKGEADLLKALALTREKNIRMDHGMVLYRLVRNNFDLADWEKYSRYSEEYISFLESGDQLNSFNNTAHRGLYFFEDNADPIKSIPVLQQIVKTHERNHHLLSSIDALKFLSTLQLKAGRHQDAILSLEQAADIAARHDYLVEMELCYQRLFSIHEDSGNTAMAYAYFKKYKAIQDSVEVLDNRNLFSELEVRYDIQKKDEALKVQQLELEKQGLVKRNLLLLSLLLMMIAIAAVGFVIFKGKSNRVLKGKNAIITKALQEKELLLREIHHRVKNNLQVISSLLNLQSRYISDQKAIEAIKDGRNRVNSMSLIHQNLYLNENLATIDVGLYLEKLSDSLFHSYNVDPGRIQFDVQVDRTELDVDTLIPLGLIINELLSNALKHAFPDDRPGAVTVRFQNTDAHFFLEVKDNGIGMNGKAIKDIRDTFGIEMIQSFAQKLKASVEFKSQQGVTVSLKIPKHAA